MSIHSLPRRVLSILLLLAPLAACSDDDGSPTDPGDPSAELIPVLVYTLTITRFECIVDGDGVEGAGEFEFTAYGGEGGQQTWERSLSSGQSAALDWSWVEGYHGYEGDPVPVEIGFRCTEWDRNILNEVYPDSNMDGRHVTATEMVTEGSISNYITMGNAQCKVRLHYGITAEVVEVESGTMLSD